MKKEKKMEIGEITDKELKIIETLAEDKSITQREISRKVGISLGMVNIILKKLARRGYVKVRRMNRRSLEYVLTPKGFAEKAKKSYRYFRNTLASLKEMKRKIQSVVLLECSKGRKNFIILGNGELADVVELSLKGLSKKGVTYRRVNREEQIKEKETVVLVTKSKFKKIPEVKVWINLYEKIIGK